MRCFNDTDITTFVIVFIVWLISSCAACYLFYNLGKYKTYKKLLKNSSVLKCCKNTNAYFENKIVDGKKTMEKIDLQADTGDKNKEISYITTYDTVAEDVTESKVHPSAPTKDVIYDRTSVKLEGNIYEDLSM